MTRIAVVHWSWLSFSETFLRNQLQGLPGTVSFLEGMPRLQSDPRPHAGGLLQLGRRLLARGFWENFPALVTWRYRQLFRRLRPQVVLAQFGPSGVFCQSACQQLGIPLVVHFQVTT